MAEFMSLRQLSTIIGVDRVTLSRRLTHTHRIPPGPEPGFL
ncbi:MAG: hypothetical protein ACP5DC_08980 [Halothiobacillaceae bacterium]